MSEPEIATISTEESLRDGSGAVAGGGQGVKGLTNHPLFFWLSVVGGVTTIIGFVLSIYFYQASQIAPLLTFGVYPIKTELQRPDFDKKLGFVYEGKPIESEAITSVQVSIWNAGTRSISGDEILDPVRLVMPDGASILSVIAKKTSRPIAGFEILGNQDDYRTGTCRLKWRILEPGDGAVFQIIYVGSASRDPNLEGIIEGQKGGILVERFAAGPNRSISPAVTGRYLTMVLSLGLGFVLLIWIASRIQNKTAAGKRLIEERVEAERHLAKIRRKRVPITLASGILLFVAFFGLVGSLWFLLSRPAGPPFGW